MIAKEFLTTVGLFAGIGGLELGLRQSGHHTILLAENYAPAAEVLRQRWPHAALISDVRAIESIPDNTDLLVAGFPCQDFSSVGLKTGLGGTTSSVVGEVFRLLAQKRTRWVLLENVPFLLRLHRGAAMRFLVHELESLGYSWAYRVIDSEAFGVPQRRRRLFLVASNEYDPRPVLLGSDVSRPESAHDRVACGFYWTEGMRALGWAVDAVPPIKGGSSIGVPSPPAILFSDGTVGTPDIRDAERLQGFPPNWTKPAERVIRPGFRWQLVGNAVTVNVSRWLGTRFGTNQEYDARDDLPLKVDDPFPAAGWSLKKGEAHSAPVGPWPVWRQHRHLDEFLNYPVKPLSSQAVEGFLKRARRGNLRFPDGFLEKLAAHARQSAA